MQVGGGPLPAVPDGNALELSVLRGAVRDWQSDAGGPQKLCYMLEHQYTQAGITAGLPALKGKDRAAAQVGVRACVACEQTCVYVRGRALRIPMHVCR